MSDLMPVLFVSHGSPMLALDEKSAREYRAWAEQLPIPKAILMFSAHWESTELEFGETVNHDDLIYDFFGFPESLYQFQYPAPGAEALRKQVQALFPKLVPKSKRGLDHGVWIPLMHMWPDADIPILQLSLPSTYSDAELIVLGQQLAVLREKGVMIIGGGTLSHNLKEGFSGEHQSTPEWAREFDQWVADTLVSDRHKLAEWQDIAPHARMNHPTPEHFRPLLIASGAASEKSTVTFPMVGFDMGVISMRSVQFDG